MYFWIAVFLTTMAACISPAGGVENFNAKTHICCNGTLSEMVKNPSCCGTVAYDVTAALCCDNKVMPLPAGEDGLFSSGCCYGPSDGSVKLYNTHTHECCNGLLLEKPDKDVFYGCCSEKLFNYKTQLCCGEKVLDRQDGDECCGEVVYNISKQICCEKWGLKEEKLVQEYSVILEKKSEHSFCCGQAVYDTASEVCCNNKVLVKPAHLPPTSAGCCGDEMLDHQTQLCCHTYTNEPDVFTTTNSKIREKSGSGSSCCGLDVFNYHEQVCCNETILPKPKSMDKETWGTCCGDKVMTSFEFQLCDNDRLIDRNSTDLWMCGNQGNMFNISKQSCCFGEVLEDSGDIACCHRASKSYNKKNENCCDNMIIPLTDEDISGGKMACCAPFPSFYNFISSAVN